MQQEQKLTNQNTFPESSGIRLHLVGMRILVVEDALDLQLLLSEILKFQGAEVYLASNGEEALQQIARSSPFDMILMDLQMPILDGYETTERLRASGYKTPILALTAHALSGERERCLALGFSEFMSKPIDIAKLIALILRWTSAAAYVV